MVFTELMTLMVALSATWFDASHRKVPPAVLLMTRLPGTAFTPGTPVTISGAATGGAQADSLGAFTTQITAPPITGLGPRTVRLTAVDRVNPANTATLELRIVRNPTLLRAINAIRARARRAPRAIESAKPAPLNGHVRQARSRFRVIPAARRRRRTVKCCGERTARDACGALSAALDRAVQSARE